MFIPEHWTSLIKLKKKKKIKFKSYDICSVSDPDGSGFFADPNPGLKVQIRPLVNLWDLNDGFDKGWMSLTIKNCVRSAR